MRGTTHVPRRLLRPAETAALIALWAAPAAAGGVEPEPCPSPLQLVIDTDDYALGLTSASGAPGEVVEVSVVLRSRLENRGSILLILSICHDPEFLEPVGEPRLAEELVSMLTPGGATTILVQESEGGEGEPAGDGWIVRLSLSPAGYDARFPSDIPLALMSLCYRIRGEPGTRTPIAFCDAELALSRERCNFSSLHTWNSERPQGWYFVSTEREEGLVTIIAGTPERTACTERPPVAAIYDRRPSPEETGFRVFLEEKAAWAGALEVPVEVRARAELDFTGIVVPVDFDERYVRVARAEGHLPAGVVLVNNRSTDDIAGAAEGNAVIASSLGFAGTRRVAPPGEDFLVARLYFDVLPETEGITEIPLTIEPVIDELGVIYDPAVYVRHLTVDGGETQSAIPPLEAPERSIHLRQPFRRGDADGDGERNVTDAVFILTFLFIDSTRTPSCLAAADVDGSDDINITDAVYLLTDLFLGGNPIPEPSASCGALISADCAAYDACP